MIFNQVLYMSFVGTIAVLLISAVKYITKDSLGIRFQWALNYILILRLLLCFGIATSISVYNYVPSFQTTMMTIPDVVGNYETIESVLTAGGNIAETSKTVVTSNNNMYYLLLAVECIWISGACVITGAMILSFIKAGRFLKKSEHIKDEYIKEVFEQSRRITGVYKNIDIVSSRSVNNPGIYGFIHPKIVIPESLLDYKRQIDFKYIFMHELVHAKKNHILINYIIFALSTVHWFNPVIKYGLNKIKEDMEISCDLEVLYLLDGNENNDYGNSLLDLAEISVRAPWLPQMAGIINNKNKLKRRIEMISKFKKSTYKKISAAALAGIVMVGGAVLTEAKAADAADAAIGQTSQIIEDRLDYDFVNDEEVVGKWEAVDFVKNKEDFKPGAKSWEDGLYIKDLIFLKDGKMAQPISENTQKPDETTPIDWMKWTKGIVMHFGDKTASGYEIKEINGDKYMFYQWKSGDYTFRGMTPYYYVLKQVK